MVKKSFGWVVIFATCIACTNREQGKKEQTLDYPEGQVSTEEVITTDDSISVVTGKLVIGHEVRSFVMEGDSVEYWFIDRSGAVQQEYERVVPDGIKKYTPVRVEMKVKYLGKSNEGFAAEYDGVYEVLELLKMEP